MTTPEPVPSFPFPSHANISSPRNVENLVTGTAGLGDDLGHLVDLRLSTAEGTELWRTGLARDNSYEKSSNGPRTLFLASLRARLSLELRSSSITRRS